MLVDRSEWACETVDISPVGVLLLGLAYPYIGQTVVVYLDGIGRLEGSVVRLRAGEFALQLHMTERRREQFAAMLGKLAEDGCVERQLHPAVASAIDRQSETPIPTSATALDEAAKPRPSHKVTAQEAFRAYLEAY